MRSDGRFSNEQRNISIKYHGRKIVFSYDGKTLQSDPCDKTNGEIPSSIARDENDVFEYSHGLNTIRTEILNVNSLDIAERPSPIFKTHEAVDKFLHIRSIPQTDTLNLSKLKNTTLSILSHILLNESPDLRIYVTILQYDNRQSTISACIVNSIVILCMLKGIPIVDCAFGISVSRLNDSEQLKRKELHSTPKNNFLVDPTQEEENRNPTMTINFDYHRKTINYCELQGKLHFKEFRSFLALTCKSAFKANHQILKYLKSL